MIDNRFSNHDFSHYAEAEKDICGIWAVFGDVNSEITQQISACMQIAHRGPDHFKFQNLNLKKNAVVGFHRLAVMDTHHQSMQPFQTLQHFNYLSYLLCYNGEIYNQSRWVGYCCTTTVNTLLCIRKWLKPMNAAYDVWALCVYRRTSMMHNSQKFTIKLPLYYRDYLRVFS